MAWCSLNSGSTTRFARDTESTEKSFLLSARETAGGQKVQALRAKILVDAKINCFKALIILPRSC
jgi:hypothetical protein